jgi:uncharacterized protein YaaQ
VAEKEINLLVVVFVMGAQHIKLMPLLRKNDFRFTEVDSSGGFLQELTNCLFIGLNSERLPALLKIIRSVCQRRVQYIPARMDVSILPGNPVMIEAEMGGAVIFAVDVEKFVQLG